MSEESVTKAGIKVINALYSLSSILKLYEVNNDAVVRIMETLQKELQDTFTEVNELHLMLRKDEFFINDQLLKVDLALYTKAREVAIILDAFNWGDIRISSEIGTLEVENFVQAFSDSLRHSKSMFPKNGFPNIKGQKARGSSAAAFRFEPERLAIWLYSGLIDIVEQIYQLHENGEQPSLLPLRRSLQMVIDNMRSQSGIYQMLSAVRDIDTARSESNKRVAVAIDSVGFGAFLHLEPSDLMVIALSGVLGGLSKSRDPIQTVQPLMNYSGLGLLALKLILTLHDARAAYQGEQVGILGQLLMIVESYHDLLDAEPDASEGDVIRRLIQGHNESINNQLTKIFARYKGPFPIGSTVKIDNKDYIVIEQPDNHKGKIRPTVAQLSGGNLIDKRDLREETVEIQSSKRKGILFSK